MKVEARHGEVVFTQYIGVEHLNRVEAAQHIQAVALAIVNASDVSDPEVQRFYAAIHRAVTEYLK